MKPADHALLALSAPGELLISAHAFPAPELADDPVAMTQLVFVAIDEAAKEAGLTDRGVFHPADRKDWVVEWGPEADEEIGQRGSIERRAKGAERESYWSYGVVVWSDPARTTFLLVTTDIDAFMAHEIIAWGPDAHDCLGRVESALDAEELWS